MRYIKKYNKFIVENKQQALSVLNNLNIDQNDEEYIKIKELVSKSPSYLGIFTKWFYEDTASFYDLEQILRFLKKGYSLNINPLSSTYEEMIDEKERIEKEVRIKSVYNELASAQRKLIDDKNDIEDFENLADKLSDLENKKSFFINSSKIDSYWELIDFMEDFIKKNGFNKKDILDIITSNRYTKLIQNEDNVVIAEILDYDASKLLGSTNWCIVNQVAQWISYTMKQPRLQYFIWNFNLDLSNPYHQIGITVGMNDKIHAAQRFDNNDIMGNLPKWIDTELLKGPTEEDIERIGIQFKHIDSKRREIERIEEEERLADKIRENEIKRENNEWEDDSYVKAAILYLEEKFNYDVEEDGDMYSVLFDNTYGQGMRSFESLLERNLEINVGTYDEAYSEAKEFLVDQFEQGMLPQQWVIDDNIDSDEIANDFCDEDYYRDEWRNYDIPGILDYNSEMKVNKLEDFLSELDDDTDVEDIRNIYDELDVDYDDQSIDDVRNDIEEKIEEIKEDQDNYDLDEDEFDKFIEEKKNDIKYSPIDYLKDDLGYEDDSLGDILKRYIDFDGLAEDVIRYDGLGSTLSSYDGEEHEYDIDDVKYCVYRTN